LLDKDTMTAISSAELPGDEVALADFERLLLPHLHAAYNLACWLTRNNQNAEDLVQEAYLRAWKSFDGFAGGDGRAWLLSIVRNTCYTWLQRNATGNLDAVFDEEIHSGETDTLNPETELLQSQDKQLLRQAVEELPLQFREVLIMRELEGLSYREIADLAGLPVGTVMSRLARARRRLQQALAGSMERAVPAAL
jgi:RNA polymerase sigma factor (sigma-70 family)